MKNNPKMSLTFYYIIAAIWLLAAIAQFFAKQYILATLDISLSILYLCFAINYSKNKK